MRFNLAHFKTRLGRRIVTLFFLCALLPAAALAGLSYYVVRSELERASVLRQHQGASSAGQGVFERLQAVENELDILRTSPFVTQASGRRDGSPATPERLRRLDALTVVTPTGTIPLIGDISVVPPLDPALGPNLALGQAVLAVASHDGGRPLRIFMAKARDPDNVEEGVLWGRVVGDSLWSTAQVYATGSAITEVDFQDATGYCILDPQKRPLDCAGGMSSWSSRGPPPEAVIADAVHGDLAWSSGDRRYVGHYRQLFMRFGFNSDPWYLVVGETESSVLQPLVQFRSTLIGIMVLTLAIVLGSSARLIGHSMEPLAKLLEGTKSIAANNFAARIDISSGDEFEEVGGSFNEMAQQVGALVEELKDLSWSTITTLARTIDAKSPWTSGHSERVAHMAVSIARTMGQPREDLERLHRGGLLHDIGKIGVPLYVIDKPTSLDEEEMQLMRDHVTTGARILEPLHALADVIPIVLYHHERFDGLGYPEGLAGTDIPLLARITCVADTYDALQSDRPYRRGRSVEDSLHVILECSGTQFDPDVVDAFLRFIRSDEEPGNLEPIPTRPKLAQGA